MIAGANTVASEGRQNVLRDDLRLFVAEHAAGEAAVMIYDPARHSYFRLAGDAVEVLARWGLGSIGDIRNALRDECRRDVSAEYIEDVGRFLEGNELVATGAGAATTRLLTANARRRSGALTQIVHNYLFFRLPLLNPARGLERMSEALAFCFRPAFWIAVASAVLCGLYLVSREWEAFASDVAQQARWSNLPVIAMALLVLKALHEFGHGLVATRMGCRVPSMGVAFMVLTPVFYTDTTDAWRLANRRARIAIVCAGVAAELVAAVFAVLLWPFLPEGMARQIAVTVAVAAPAMSLLVNLNPFMRFDGYFLLMDVLGVENLQSRAFAYARWRLREALFAPGLPPPELATPARAKVYVIWSWATWIYRLILFTGIALFVYAFFIKLLGIILFIIEIGWFVVLPVWREAKEWWSQRDALFVTRRAKITFGIGLLAVCLAIMPWRTSVHVPALLTGAQEQALHPQLSGRIAELQIHSSGQRVRAGDLILRLESLDLEIDLQKTRIALDLLHVRIARLAGDPAEQKQLPVLQKLIVSHQEKLHGLQRMRDDLALRAPVDGVLQDVEPDLHVGRWLRPAQRIATIVAGPLNTLRALAGEAEIVRISTGDRARFIPDDGAQGALDAVVSQAASVNEPWLFHESFASSAGGSIPAVRDASGRLRPQHPVFAIRLEATGQTAAAETTQSLRGVAVIAGRAESFITMIWRRIARVAIRESGF